jgi:rfaE bifunctional protein nucleotidyltransferase chain/domain
MRREPAVDRVVTRERAIASVHAWKAERLRVVLANGVFDLLHVGHARYLAGARSLGDRLVVAVNGDRSAQALKGPGRPVQSARERAELVAGLRGVDRVVIFDEPSVDALLESLAPDVHAKGTDYRVDTVPERATMARLGGVTAIAGDVKQHASGELYQRIRRGEKG